MQRLPSVKVSGDTNGRKDLIEQQFLWFAFFNFFLVSLIGLFLRSFLYISTSLNYKYVLHGHSHFAFGGWIMPVLTYTIMHYFPAVKETVAYKHWRNIFLLMMFSAYGMLLTFPFEGYATGSIIFSTLSVAAGVYLSICVSKALRRGTSSYSEKFLQAGIVYLLISSIGPFATGPIAATAGPQSTLFTDAIYYFLHFQYNGFFSFVVLAVWYRLFERGKVVRHGKTAFTLFNIACIPTYFLSILWHQPGIICNVVGGAGALLQVVGVFFVMKDFNALKSPRGFVRLLMNIALVALVMKVVLQLASAFPLVADIAYHHRNFIIAYLHLVLLGFISLLAIGFILHSRPGLNKLGFKVGTTIFISSILITNLLLALQAMGETLHFYIPQFTFYMWATSILFPASIAIMLIHVSSKAGIQLPAEKSSITTSA
jgi:hypothetical protein